MSAVAKDVLFERVLSMSGMTIDDVKSTSRVGRIMRRDGVPDSDDLRRVLSLPRRQWEIGVNGTPEEMSELITRAYRRPNGKQKLRPVQAAVLTELADFGGVFGLLRVGGGKSLITFLAPKVVNAKRPLLFIPAKLRKKTKRDIEIYQEHWVLPDLEIAHYEKLYRTEHENFLEEYKPDLIMLDEAHRAKRRQTSATKRLHRYIMDHPEVIVMCLSGTMTRKTLLEYWHLMLWCRGRKNMPMPSTENGVKQWADALDVKGEGLRTAPGALCQMCDEEELKQVVLGGEAELTAVRRAYQRRLTQTPGVISTVDEQVACSLVIEEVKINLEHLAPYFRQLRKGETPDGQPWAEALEMWRHARELVCGFYYRWRVRPPKPWLKARKTWCRFVRHTIRHTRKFHFDTELQVINAVLGKHIAQEYEDPDTKEFYPHVYDDWAAVRDTFEPQTEAVWLDDTMLKFCTKWLKNNRGICWVEHKAFGERLSEMSGFPYYAGKGMSKDRKFILDETGSMIASIGANSEGHNLQHYSEMLLPSVPPNSLILEQLLGRMHRDGQEADEVLAQMVLGCKEQLWGFYSALDEARYVEESTGASQKLLFADLEITSREDMFKLEGALWE